MGVERNPVLTTVSEGFSGSGLLSGGLIAAAVGPGTAVGAGAGAGAAAGVGAVADAGATVGGADAVDVRLAVGAGASDAPVGEGTGRGSTGVFAATGSSGLSLSAITYPVAKQITPKPMATAMPMISWLELQSLPTGSRP